MNISDNEFLIFATFETPALNVILENEFETSLCFIPYGCEYKEAARMKESTAFTEAWNKGSRWENNGKWTIHCTRNLNCNWILWYSS